MRARQAGNNKEQIFWLAKKSFFVLFYAHVLNVSLQFSRGVSCSTESSHTMASSFSFCASVISVISSQFLLVKFPMLCRLFWKLDMTVTLYMLRLNMDRESQQWKIKTTIDHWYIRWEEGARTRISVGTLILTHPSTRGGIYNWE